MVIKIICVQFVYGINILCGYVDIRKRYCLYVVECLHLHVLCMRICACIPVVCLSVYVFVCML